MRTRDLTLRSLLALVLLASLATLAVLQHRWTTTVSVAERQRLRAGVGEALTHLERAFDREVTQVILTFWVDPGRFAARDSRDWHARLLETTKEAYAQWQRTAALPRLVKDLLLIDAAAPNDITLYRIDTTERRLEPIPWPHELRDLARRFTDQTRVDPRTGGVPPRESLGPYLGQVTDGLLVGIPAIIDPRGAPDREVDAPPTVVKALLLVRLDRDFIIHEWMPTLVERYLSGAQRDYDVVVRSGGEKASVVYARSTRNPREVIAAPDARVRLFIPRLDELEHSPSAEGRGEPARPGDGLLGREDIAEVTGNRPPVRRHPPPEGTARRQTGARRFIAEAVERGYEKAGSGPTHGEANTWQLLVKHRAGSVEAAAESSRRQNLVLSYGILAVLAASMGFVILSAGRARRLARQQVEFVASVSHELRTPVAAIRSMAENLADGLIRSEEQCAQYGTLLVREARRLGDQVEQTLEYAGVSSGSRRYERLPVSLDRVLRRAVEACQPQLRERGIECQQSAEPDLPPIVGDEDALVCAVSNLIQNALKYSPRGTAVSARLRRASSALELAVADSGIGIDAADRRRLFQPFFRGANAVRSQSRGVGIGLSLVRAILTAHGGTVHVDSRLGEGSTFTLRFPLSTADRGDPPTGVSAGGSSQPMQERGHAQGSDRRG